MADTETLNLGAYRFLAQAKTKVEQQAGDLRCRSERYTTRASAEAGVTAVKANAGNDARYEKREAKNGQVYFVLKAVNHEIVGISEMYTSAAALATGIAAVKVNAAAAGEDEPLID